MPFKLDPELEKYCATENQWNILKAWEKHGSKQKAAEALGIDKRRCAQVLAAVTKRAAQHGYSPDHQMTNSVPFGFSARGVSTLYDLQTGEAKIQWVKSSADQEARDEAVKEAIEAMCDDLPRLPKRKTKPKIDNDELMTVIPMGDPHFGMYSWAAETGENFDLEIARRDLCAAVDYLVSQSPPSKRCVLINLGDFFHCDNMKGQTSQSANNLDVDGRLSKVINIGVAALRQCIESALDRHETVEIINVIGNHDEVLSRALDVIFSNTYENEPRVIVHDQPTHRHYIQHGKVLIGTTHGDRTKDRDLPGIMATEKPVQWGETTHRYYYRGHHHHDTLEMFNGCTVEQFSTLAPNDAWHHAGGYLTGRNMKLIVHHKNYGEVARSVCSIDMLKDMAS